MKLSAASGRPAPRWFRIFKKVWTNTENTVIALLLIKGYTSEAPLLLIIKLISSYILVNLDTILVNGQRYIDVDELDSLKENKKELEQIKEN